MSLSPLTITQNVYVLDVTTNQHPSSSKEERAGFESVASRYLSEINRGVKPTNEAKMIRFPSWRAWEEKDTYTKAINSYLLRVGGRLFYRMYKERTFPTELRANWLSDFLEEIIWDKSSRIADEHDDYKAPSKSVLTRRDVEYLARSASAHLLETMTWQQCHKLYLERAADGRRGGLGSRRGPSTTKDMLEPVGDRKPEQYYRDEAERLKVSTRTIKRRVAEAREAADALALEEEIDALLAPKPKAPSVAEGVPSSHPLDGLEYQLLIEDMVQDMKLFDAEYDEYEAQIKNHERFGEARWKAAASGSWVDDILAA